MSAKNVEFYLGKTALAPMVRAGRTPLRVLSLEYGADLAYTEEIIDARLLQCKRIENDALGTVDYTLGDEIVLRVAKEEVSKCVLQIGTNSARNAVEVCRKIGKDVAAIDVNMGCPKPFSVHNGMGAALLTQPDCARGILTALVEASTIPISCKIRLLDKSEETLEFAKMAERCGISAIGVHGRRRDERPNDTNRANEIRQVSRYVDVPVLANGFSSKMFCFEDIERFRVASEASGVLLGRKALSNPSIFRSEGGVLQMDMEIRNFLRKCCEYDEGFTNTKYVVQRILGSAQEFDLKGKATVAASSNLEICKVWSMEAEYLETRRRRALLADIVIANDDAVTATLTGRKRRFELIDGVNVAAGLSFAPKKLTLNAGSGTPKCAINSFCDEMNMERPSYETHKRAIDGRYESTILVAGKRFRSTTSQPNKKMAEHVAALSALIGLDQRKRLSDNYESE